MNKRDETFIISPLLYELKFEYNAIVHAKSSNRQSNNDFK